MAITAENRPVTSADIRTALKRHFPHPEFGIVFECAAGTGHHASRHIDALAMSLWPSRGLDLHAIEIKADRHDFRREKKNPAKAEELARFCDYFWIAAPDCVVPIPELPPAWGLLEMRAPGGVLKITRHPVKTAAIDGGRTFLAAVFRAAARPIGDDELRQLVQAETEQVRAAWNERLDKAVADRVKREQGDNIEAAANWRRLCADLGEPDKWGVDPVAIAGAFRVARKLGVGATYGDGLQNLRHALETGLTKLAEFEHALGVQRPTKDTLV
jgi:hypothetical protein